MRNRSGGERERERTISRKTEVGETEREPQRKRGMVGGRKIGRARERERERERGRDRGERKIKRKT